MTITYNRKIGTIRKLIHKYHMRDQCTFGKHLLEAIVPDFPTTQHVPWLTVGFLVRRSLGFVVGFEAFVVGFLEGILGLLDGRNDGFFDGFLEGCAFVRNDGVLVLLVVVLEGFAVRLNEKSKPKRKRRNL